HEVWEHLWHDTAGPDRRFYQGLIQAAVAVYHAGKGNARGARRLFESGRRDMSAYNSPHLGLGVRACLAAPARALADFLTGPPPSLATLRRDELPTILLKE